MKAGKVKFGFIVTLSILLAFTCVALGQETEETEKAETKKQVYTGGDPSEPHHHLFYDADWLDEFHNPTDWLEMGLDFRFREVFARNIIGLNEDAVDPVTGSPANNHHYERIRTRWSTKTKLTDDIDFNTRLTWEFFMFHSDPFPGKEQDVDFDEAIFDHFNLTFRNAFDMPLRVVVGRQDIILGTGWLVLEGTPADGSRTIYFDTAVRGTYQVNEENKLDMIFLKNYNDENKWLSPIDPEDTRKGTYGQDETGAILYWTNNSIKNTQVEGYYILKNDTSTSSPVRSKGPASEIHTLGARLSGDLDENWYYSFEGARQFGQKALSRKGAGFSDDVDDKKDLDAWGFNSRLQYNFKDVYKNEIHLTGEYLSGDDPDTSDNEQFDPLWGEYPQAQRGGDLLAYAYAMETNLGETTNLWRAGVGHSFKPAKKWTFAWDYNLLWADENTLGAGNNNNSFSTGDNFRGQLATAWLKYRCCKQFNYYLLFDYFVPDDYYADSNQDEAWFARFNMEYTF